MLYHPHTYSLNSSLFFFFFFSFSLYVESWAFDNTTLNIQFGLFVRFYRAAAAAAAASFDNRKVSYVMQIVRWDPNILTKQRTKLKNFKFAK